MIPLLTRRPYAAFVRRFTTASTAALPKPEASATTTTGTTVLKNSGGGGGGGGGRDTLGRRLLSLIYVKRSAVITIRKWKEEGRSVRKYELNRAVRELRRRKRYKHALEVCEWMRIQDDMKLVPGDYAVHLDLIAKVRGMTSAEKFFEDLPDNMRDHTTCTSLLHTYVQFKDLAKSEGLMKKMSECGFLKCPLPYNHLLSLYISMGKLEKVPALLQELLKNTSPDVVTYNLWLSVCSTQNEVETAEKIVLAMKKKKIDPDWVTHSTLANIYLKSSLKDKAAVTLKEMEKAISEKDRVAYASLISLHRQLQNEDEVVRIWRKMKSIFKKLNDAEYNCMISSLLKLDKPEEAEKLYAEWESVSPTRDARISNLLLADYINNNLMEKAENFHKQTVEKGIPPSYTTWELFTWSYLKQEKLDKALDCFKKMLGTVKRWDPDRKMIRAVFAFMEEHGETDGAEELLVMLRHAGYVNTEIYNSLLRTYAKAGKMPLIVAERMKQDNVQLDEKTHELIALTSKMCVSDVPSSLSKQKCKM